jgi:hypothetical protein
VAAPLANFLSASGALFIRSNLSYLDCRFNSLIYETRIREHLTDEQFQIEPINDVLGFFTWLLNAILAGLDKPDPKRYWVIDSLYCTEVHRETTKIFISGKAYWLEGGKQCDFFEAEIEPTEQSINYIIWFIEKPGASTLNLTIRSNAKGIFVQDVLYERVSNE